MKLSWNYKIKFFQLLCYVGGPLVIIFNFNLSYLLFALLAHWIIVNLGISCGLHRGFSHRSWEPKNKLILIMMHFLTVINTIGSTITWCGTHRLHHKTADTEKDPHSPVDKSVWTKIKYWFNYWPAHSVSYRLVKDLTKDRYHVFFHRNYFKILISYLIILLMIDIDLFLYGYLVTTMFSLHAISWITVGAHLFGKQDNSVRDQSKNTFIMGLYLWGEGWHNNHHHRPYSYEFGRSWKQPDLGKYVIRFLAKPESLRHLKHESC